MLHAGRIQTIIVFETVGVSTMAYMGLVTSSWTVLPLIIPLYLLRCTANNSVYALQVSACLCRVLCTLTLHRHAAAPLLPCSICLRYRWLIVTAARW